jgi:uncharacterized membrane protein YagU involved in acid resistance
LDITYACVFWAIGAGVAPPRIFQSVAAGWLGRDAARAGGAATAALGLATHFFIAITVSAVYYVVARRMPVLRRRPWSMGALYGIAVYVVMNRVVVPLSAASKGSQDPLWVGLSIVVHMFFIGVPVAVFAREALTPPSDRDAGRINRPS